MSGTLRACTGLHWDCFTFTLLLAELTLQIGNPFLCSDRNRYVDTFWSVKRPSDFVTELRYSLFWDVTHRIL